MIHFIRDIHTLDLEQQLTCTQMQNVLQDFEEKICCCFAADNLPNRTMSPHIKIFSAKLQFSLKSKEKSSFYVKFPEFELLFTKKSVIV